MPPLLLIPGLLCDADLWRDQIPALAERWSVHVPLLTTQTSMAAMADAAVALIGADDRPFAVAGLSMGGHVTFEILRRYGDRVSQAIILDSSARADDPKRAEQRERHLKMAQLGKFMGVTDRLLPTLIHPDRLAEPALTGRIKAMAQTVGRDGFFNQTQALMTRIDSRPALPKIACPCLVICGRQDQLTPPAQSEEMADAIPGARLEIVETCGHLSTMERPDTVRRLMNDFLLP